jgi:spermidine/putrescine-binding protein
MNKSYTRREFLGISTLALAGAAILPSLLLEACSNEKNTVNFLNWSRYIAPDTLSHFTQKTGIKVNYEEFSSEEAMFTKLKSGAQGYDLAVVTDYLVPKFKALGLIDEFPAGSVPNAKNIAPRFRRLPYDPSGDYALPYLWGTTGIGFNRTDLKKRPDSWHDLWNPLYSGKISMLDDARDCVSTALLMLNQPAETQDPKVLAQAKQLLISQRPLVYQYSNDTYIDSLAAGNVSLAMGWSGDVLQAAEENAKIDYLIPKEGSYLWVDNLCLIRNGPHKKEALQLANYLLEGKIAADIANFVRYATPNAAALSHIKPVLLRDPRIYPTPAIDKRLRFTAILDDATLRKWDQIWMEVKAA